MWHAKATRSLQPLDSFGDFSQSCGQRINFLTTFLGGSFSLDAAKDKIATDFEVACGACSSKNKKDRQAVREPRESTRRGIGSEESSEKTAPASSGAIFGSYVRPIRDLRDMIFVVSPADPEQDSYPALLEKIPPGLSDKWRFMSYGELFPGTKKLAPKLAKAKVIVMGAWSVNILQLAGAKTNAASFLLGAASSNIGAEIIIVAVTLVRNNKSGEIAWYVLSMFTNSPLASASKMNVNAELNEFQKSDTAICKTCNGKEASSFCNEGELIQYGYRHSSVKGSSSGGIFGSSKKCVPMFNLKSAEKGEDKDAKSSDEKSAILSTKKFFPIDSGTGKKVCFSTATVTDEKMPSMHLAGATSSCADLGMQKAFPLLKGWCGAKMPNTAEKVFLKSRWVASIPKVTCDATP